MMIRLSAACLALLVATPAAFGQTLSAPGLSFGNQAVGETSTARSISFRNTLAIPVTLQSVTVSGGQAADFAATPGCVMPAVVAPSRTCAVSVRFTPGALGARASSLVFAHDQAGSPLTATLSGTGVAPVSLAPSTVAFGSVLIGAVSATRTATLTNAQNAPLSISSITLAAPFSRQGGTCPAGPGVLAGRASCTILMAFSPVAAGAANGSLTVVHNASNSPSSAALSGVGVAPLSPSPASLSFPSRTVGTTSPPANVTLANKSGAVLALGAIAASGDFAVSSTTCGASLAVAAQCVVRIVFSPTATGARAGVLSVTHGAAGSPLQVPLAGTGNVTGLQSVAITPPNITLGLGKYQQLTATGTYANGSTADLSAASDWLLGMPLRGRVASGGQYLALASGANTVTASVGAVQGQTTVTGARPVFSYKRTTATLLLDGRVLIAGGTDGDFNPTATAELFDPTTGTFSATAPMSTARYGHSATRLPDGRVLVAGGGFPSLNTAEIYDPVTGTWTPTGSMVVGRAFQRAVVVGTKVLMAAGYSGWLPLETAELFDPATGTFALTGSLATARWGHTATLLNDGRVLVVGGSTVGAFTPGVTLGSAEIYNPASGTWTPAGSLATPRSSHAATRLQNGKVLVAGGGGAGVVSAELFDPASGAWLPTGNLPTPMARIVAALLPNGQVLLTASGRATSVYDAASGTFEPGPPMAYDRSDHAGALLDDGSMLLIGGYGTLAQGREAADSAELRTGPIVMTGLTVTPAVTQATHPATVTFTATGTFSDGSTGDVTSLATWTATPPSVATVTSAGTITTAGPGTATVTATYGTFAFDATLTVQ